MHRNSSPNCDRPHNRNNRTGLSTIRFWTAAFALALGLLFLHPCSAPASAQEKQLPAAVDLASDNLSTRDRAEEQAVEYLVENNLQIDAWLAAQPNSPLLSSAELRHRLARIRFLVAEARQAKLLLPTLVKLEEPRNAEQFLAQLSTQTNAKLRWNGSTDELNALKVPPSQTGNHQFWQSLDQFRELNSLTMTTSDLQIQLAKASEDETQESRILLSHSSGPVWAGLLDSKSRTGKFDQIRVRLIWEPKLNVVSAQFPLANLEIKNEDGSDWGTFNKQATIASSIRGQQAGVETRLPIRRLEAESVQPKNQSSGRPSSIELPFRLVVLSEPTIAKFPNVLDLETPLLGHNAGSANVTVARRQQQANVVRVQILTKYDAKKMAQAIRSHDTWSQNCQALLLANDGSKLEPVSQQQLSQSEFEHLMEYQFQLPDEGLNSSDTGTWALEFRTPSGMMEVKDTITLRQGSR